MEQTDGGRLACSARKRAAAMAVAISQAWAAYEPARNRSGIEVQPAVHAAGLERRNYAADLAIRASRPTPRQSMRAARHIAGRHLDPAPA